MELHHFSFFVVFKTWITPDFATEYLAGAVLLGAAPCTAMVFVWSTLTKGNPAYTVVQVASNDIIILFAFVPIVKFLLGVSNVSVPFQTLFMSVDSICSNTTCSRNHNKAAGSQKERYGIL